MRAIGIVFVVTALGAPARAGDPADVRPGDHAIAEPMGDWEELPIPADLHRDPPADGWWTRKNACPARTRLVVAVSRVNDAGEQWRSYRCKGKTRAARPFTAMTIAGTARRDDGWVDAQDRDHGAYRHVDDREERSGVIVHGTETGLRTVRAVDGSTERITAMRGGARHGLAAERTGALWASGYLDDDHRDGVWLIWQASDGVVRARLHYTDSHLIGPQRWWAPDGTVLARGTVAPHRATWTITTGGARSETRCEYDELAQVEAWDAAGALTLRICGALAATGCKPVGPTDPAAQHALGAAPGLCKSPDVAPLGF